jgi:hypothetical protein
MTMRALLWIPLLIRTAVPVQVVAPPVDQMKISVSAHTIGVNRGEVLNTWISGRRGNGALVLQEPQHAALSMMRSQCGFHVRPSEIGRSLDDGAVGGWITDVTPIRVVDRRVTFRVGWTRLGEDGKTPAAHGDQDATLSPGESLPLDLVPLSARERQSLPAGCDMIATSLRVGVEYVTSPKWDRRLVDTDVWLIEHVPGGTDRSQHTQIRSEFNVPVSFYFDDITTREGILDIGGRLILTQRDGYIEVELEPWSRLTDPAGGTDMNTMFPLHIQLGIKSNDVGAIELPPLKALTPPRTFSIRIQTRQIR